MQNWQRIILLAILGFTVSGSIAFFQDSPGYMDADYYYAGGLQLADGKGFNEPYLWNYLDNPVGLPHPSHSYWMPLASILSVMGMSVTGLNSWWSGRILFLIIAAAIPVITYSLAYSFSSRRDLAFLSGLLAIFSGFYAAFIPVTDTFGIYMLLGGLFFLLAHKKGNWFSFGLGVISGFMNLARADGIIWLFISLILIFIIPVSNSRYKNINKILSSLLSVTGYLLIMGAWFIRNKGVFGTFFAPGGNAMLWLTSYNQIFAYPPGSISFAAWIETGFVEVINIRLWALNINLQNALASQASIFLLPMVIIGAWKFRKDIRVIVAITAWLGYMILMSVIFPFAGARGGFFHSGASLQPMWWALAPIGLESIIGWLGKKRSWNLKQATRFFQWSMVGFSIFLTVIIVTGKIFNPSDGRNIWSREFNLYRQLDKIIESDPSVIPTVIVANPPGFYLATGKSAVAIPDGIEMNTLLVANQFNANYLILEQEGYPEGLERLYKEPDQNSNFIYLGESDGARVFKIKP